MNRLFIPVLVFVFFGFVFPLRIYAETVVTGTSFSCVNLQNSMQVGARDATTGGEVTSLQSFLAEGGFLNVDPTGYFGVLTERAVVAYQTARGIEPALGFVGPITQGKIKAETCGVVAVPVVPVSTSTVEVNFPIAVANAVAITSVTATTTRTAPASLLNNIAQFRSFAGLVYQANRSYVPLCSGGRVNTSVTVSIPGFGQAVVPSSVAMNQAMAGVTCYSSSDRYVLSMNLSNDRLSASADTYCVDSSGVSGYGDEYRIDSGQVACTAVRK